MQGLDELEQYLRTATILSSAGPVAGGGGHPGKQRLLLAGGVQVIAKPAIEREETHRMIRCEAAGWQVAKAMGFEGLVAATVIRSIPDGNGEEIDASVQVFWPDGNQFCALVEVFPEEDVWQAAAFDAVVLHADRGGNNWLSVPAPGAQEAPRLKLIDNGYAFEHGGNASVNSTFFNLLQGQELPENVTDGLQRLLDRWPVDELEDLLEPDVLDRLRERAHDLLQRGILGL